MLDSVQPQRQKPTLWWLLTEGPGSSVHGIFQARVLEWGAIAFSEVKLRIQNYLRIDGKFISKII